jgi:hypothetical protein
MYNERESMSYRLPDVRPARYARCPYCGDQYPYYYYPPPGYCLSLTCIEAAIKAGKFRVVKLRKQNKTS